MMQFVHNQSRRVHHFISKTRGPTASFLPFLSWSRHLRPTSLAADLFAGLTVSLVLIPQAIAYAQLAGLPPQYGLYAAFLPPILAALFGSSPQLSTGPVAVVSLLTASVLGNTTFSQPADLVNLAMLLALLVGIIQLILGAFRLGIVINFLSQPVILGFSNAAALIIATSQLPNLFGVPIDTYSHHYQTLYHFFLSAIHNPHWPSITMAVFAFLLIYATKLFYPKLPSILFVVIVTTLISWVTQFQQTQIISHHLLSADSELQYIILYNQHLDQLAQKIRDQRQLLHLQSQSIQTNSLDTETSLLQLDFEIDDLRNQVRLDRQRLRSFKFSQLTDHQGDSYFKSLPHPSSAEKSTNSWHLKVTSDPIDLSALQLLSGGNVVGAIPSGLPTFGFPVINLGTLPGIFNTALIIALLGFMESITIAKSLATKTRDTINPNQELLGQGLANLGSSLTHSFPVAGSFSRTAVNYQVGARTGLSSIFSSIFVLLTLVFFTPLLYYLPQPVLAVVIITSVIGLVNFEKIFQAWRAHRSDGVVALITFGTTLFYAPHLDRGILLGVLLSTGYYLYTRSRPRMAILTLSPDGLLIESTRHTPVCQYLEIIRFDGSLFFANSAYLETSVLSSLTSKPQAKYIFLICDSINYIDFTGIEMISHLLDRLRETNKQLILINLKPPIFQKMKTTGLIDKLGHSHIYPDFTSALSDLHHSLHSHGSKTDCPLA